MSTTPYKRIGNNLEKKENNAKKIYEKKIKIIANATKSHVTHKNNNTKNYTAINFNTGIKKLSLEKKNSKIYKSIFGTKDIYKESNLLDFISLLYKSGYITNNTNNTNNTSSKSSKSNTNSTNSITNTNNTSSTNNKNIRIVCHSGLMQKFLHKIIDSSNNGIKNKVKNIENIYDQNLWSIFLKTENNNYISITRHAYTFANFLKSKGKSLSGILNLPRKILTKWEQTHEKDTALSLYGIFTSLKQGEDLFNYEKSKNKIQNYSYTIFVSVLIRTWMTAICLYLPNFSTENKNENFSLYVSPFIKESGSTLDNTPDTIENQMKNIYEFIYFFTRRDKNNKNIFIDKILHSSNDDVIKKNIDKISEYFKSGKKLDIFIPEKNLKYTFFYEKDKLTNEVTKMEKNIFSDNKSNKINELNIKNISIFEGKEKLSKDFLGEISRWCEPFSKKNTFLAKRSLTGKNCQSRIKETPNEVVL
jgi:hypothetical protein